MEQIANFPNYYITKIGEEIMNDLESREFQCKKDIEKLQGELKEIRQKIAEEFVPKWKNGDRFKNIGYKPSYGENNVRVLIQIKGVWYVLSNNSISTYYQGTYEDCVRYINTRGDKHPGDHYVYVDNIFEC